MEDATTSLLPSFAEVVYQILTQKAKGAIDAHVLQHKTTFDSELAQSKLAKDGNWKQLGPSLGHPQNASQLNALDSAEQKRSQSLTSSGISHYDQIEVRTKLLFNFAVGVQAECNWLCEMGVLCRRKLAGHSQQYRLCRRY